MSTETMTPDLPPEGFTPPEGDGFFVLRPEVMRHLPVNVYEGDLEEALAQYASADGREKVFKELVSSQEAVEKIKELYPNFDLDQFSNDLNDLGVLLDKEKDYYNDIVELLKTRQRFFEDTVPGEYSFSQDDLQPEGGGRSRFDETMEKLLKRRGKDASESETEKKNIFRRAWDSVRNFPKNHPIVTTLLAFAAAAWGISKLWGLLAGIVPVPNLAPEVGEILNSAGATAAEADILGGPGVEGVTGSGTGL